jgi:maltooligosyltrehalose trehalohydrolase
MLFMGQEWAASTPFLFFTDHNPELSKLIIEGRREEFKHFAAFSEPAVLEKIPNPQKPSSYDASKLVWNERHRGPHALALELYRTCLALRASDPAFRPTNRDSWNVEELSIGVGALQLQSELSEWIVLFDLIGGHEGSLRGEAIFQCNDAKWRVVLSSNETRFGGEGACALDVNTMRAAFSVPETIVLRRL